MPKRKFLTKDNFWNLMFWVMMTLGFFLTTLFEMPIIFWANLLITPYIISKKQKLFINANGIFVNSEGELLDNRYPTNILIKIIFSIMFLVVIGVVLDSFKVDIDIKILAPIMFSTAILPLVLYFIYKNCPISLIFTLRAWTPNVLGFEFTKGSRKSSELPTTHNVSAQYTSPSYDYLSYNIHHNKHRR